jgi:hypothetical protein
MAIIQYGYIAWLLYNMVTLHGYIMLLYIMETEDADKTCADRQILQPQHPETRNPSTHDPLACTAYVVNFL